MEEDDKDIGITYTEMAVLSKLRSELLCGPFSFFDNIVEMWPGVDISKLENKVRNFFGSYAASRSKTWVATPSIYLTNRCLDAKGKDLRPIFYQGFVYQYRKMHKIRNQVQLQEKSNKFKADNHDLVVRRGTEISADSSICNSPVSFNYPLHTKLTFLFSQIFFISHLFSFLNSLEIFGKGRERQ